MAGLKGQRVRHTISHKEGIIVEQEYNFLFVIFDTEKGKSCFPYPESIGKYLELLEGRKELPTEEHQPEQDYRSLTSIYKNKENYKELQEDVEKPIDKHTPEQPRQVTEKENHKSKQNKNLYAKKPKSVGTKTTQRRFSIWLPKNFAEELDFLLEVYEIDFTEWVKRKIKEDIADDFNNCRKAITTTNLDYSKNYHSVNKKYVAILSKYYAGKMETLYHMYGIKFTEWVSFKLNESIEDSINDSGNTAGWSFIADIQEYLDKKILSGTSSIAKIFSCRSIYESIKEEIDEEAAYNDPHDISDMYNSWRIINAIQTELNGQRNMNNLDYDNDDDIYDIGPPEI